MAISVVINTKNSAATLGLALKSVVELADEIVVVDMRSTDRTEEVARQYTDRFFEYPDVGYVEPARNFAIKKATHEWILILDSDEEVSPGLSTRLKELVADPQAAECYYLPRKNIVFDKWLEHTGWWPDYQLRFFRKGQVEWGNDIHSFPVTRGQVKELPPEENLALLHHNYQTVEQFITRLNRYTTIQAKEKTESKNIVRAFKEEFMSRYFYNQGFLDGQHGVGVSFLQAMYEVVVALKTWQAQGFRDENNLEENLKELEELRDDLSYWIKTTRIHQASGLGNLWWRLRRKLKF